MRNVSIVYALLFIAIVAFLANCGSESEVEKEAETQVTAISIGSVVARSGGNVDVPISLDNDVEIAGVQLTVQFNSNFVTIDKPRTTRRCTDMMVMHNVKENELLLMMYNMSGKTISPGSGPILMLPVYISQNASRTIDLELTKALLATLDAQTIPVTEHSGKITVRP